MSFLDKLKKHYNNTNEIIEFRYQASKTVLVIVALLFFLSFFFIAAGYYREVFIELISVFYLLLLLSLNIYFYFLVDSIMGKKFTFFSKIQFILTLFVLFLILIIPLLYKGGIYGIYFDFIL